MSRRAELIDTYARDLKEKCGEAPDMDLLTKVTVGCGPSIYRSDSSRVAGANAKELATIKTRFLMKRLGLLDGPELDAGLVIDRCGRQNRNRHRAMVYYLLTRHFGRQAAYA